MLPHKNRLKLPAPWSKTNPDFQVKTDLFKLVGKNVPEGRSVRIGFIISSKVGKAAVRNRLRRELARFFYQELTKIKNSQELVVIVFPAMAKVSNEEIISNLNKVLQKIRFE